MKKHQYKAKIIWTGNRGSGTTGYKSYSRDHTVEIKGKPVIVASADPSFHGDPSKHNPEELFLASLSACHMLWYLHLCSVNDIIVTAYCDQAEGEMHESKDGSGRFTGVTLYPVVEIEDVSNRERAENLHQEANRMCFIANSCNFPVEHQVQVHVSDLKQ